MNVQNIPRDDKVVKAAFRPKLDAFLNFDYPNIELKLLGYYLEKIGHPSMAQVFRDDADLHVETAASIFNFPAEELARRHAAGERDDPSEVPTWLRYSLEKEGSMRQVAKRVNFSIVYGGGVGTLIEQSIVQDAKSGMALLREYHDTWPGIGWQTKRKSADEGTLSWWLEKRLKERGYFTTLWGRHLHPRSAHVSINCLCQGGAADLMKEALIKIHRYLTAHNMRSHLVNVVHDDAMLDCVREEIPTLLKVVPDLMTHEEINRVVPIRPEPDISWTTWADKVPYKEAA